MKLTGKEIKQILDKDLVNTTHYSLSDSEPFESDDKRILFYDYIIMDNITKKEFVLQGARNLKTLVYDWQTYDDDELIFLQEI